MKMLSVRVPSDNGGARGFLHVPVGRLPLLVAATTTTGSDVTARHAAAAAHRVPLDPHHRVGMATSTTQHSQHRPL